MVRNAGMKTYRIALGKTQIGIIEVDTACYEEKIGMNYFFMSIPERDDPEKAFGMKLNEASKGLSSHLTDVYGYLLETKNLEDIARVLGLALMLEFSALGGIKHQRNVRILKISVEDMNRWFGFVAKYVKYIDIPAQIRLTRPELADGCYRVQQVIRKTK